MSGSRGSCLMLWLKRAVLCIIIVSGLAAGGTACSSAPSYPGTMYYNSTAYCPYLYSYQECYGHPGTPMLVPSAQPAYGSLAYDLYLWHVGHEAWYGSPRYFNTIPTSTRTYYHLTSYTVYSHNFAQPYRRNNRGLQGQAQSFTRQSNSWARQVSSGNRGKTNTVNNGRYNNNGPRYNPRNPANRAPAVRNPNPPRRAPVYSGRRR